jgi:hypothetical protein
MAKFRIALTPAKRTAGRFAATVRRELQKALAEEHKSRGLTQAGIAFELGVNRSVIHRQIVGHENMTIGRVGEIAGVLGREPNFSLPKSTVPAGTNDGPPRGTDAPVANLNFKDRPATKNAPKKDAAVVAAG